jgi:hypothetical protein
VSTYIIEPGGPTRSPWQSTIAAEPTTIRPISDRTTVPEKSTPALTAATNPSATNGSMRIRSSGARRVP